MKVPPETPEQANALSAAIDGINALDDLNVFDDPDGFLDPDTFAVFQANWRDRQLHGRVPVEDRAGHALNAADMRGLAPGLFDSAYYHLRERGLENQLRNGTAAFLKALVARSSTRGHDTHVAGAIEVATLKLAGPDGIRSLDQHAEDLTDLLATHPDILRLALLGDFSSAQAIVLAIADARERHRLIRALARQRIVWGAADVHRIAARGAEAARHHVAWFVRPFLKKWTANEYLLFMRATARRGQSLFRALDLAAESGKMLAHIRGPKGAAVSAIHPVAATVENTLNEKSRQAIRGTRGRVEAGLDKFIAEYEAVLYDPNRSEQQTIHQYVTANLSEVATLFVTAYRFAEDESHMTAIIADPTNPSALWSVGPHPFNAEIDNRLATRAQRLVAAYRPAILRDIEATPYDPNEIRLAEISMDAAWKFLRRIANHRSVAATAQELEVMRVLDLSHQYRQ